MGERTETVTVSDEPIELTEAERWRGGKVLLHTALVRDELFTWVEQVSAGGVRTLVDTWTIEGHPDGKGGEFTLYACTVVLLPA